VKLMLKLVHAIDAMGYAGIVLLMAMESSVLPVPSETGHAARRVPGGGGADEPVDRPAVAGPWAA